MRDDCVLLESGSIKYLVPGSSSTHREHSRSEDIASDLVSSRPGSLHEFDSMDFHK